jgi:hypothetical protein
MINPFMNNYYSPPNSPSAPPFHQANINYDVPAEIVNDVNNGRSELIRQGFEGHEARVCLILDVSASMQNPNEFFWDEMKGNQVQLLINKALALGKIQLIEFKLY